MKAEQRLFRSAALRLRWCPLLICACWLLPAPSSAQENVPQPVQVSEIAPRFHLLSTAEGNLLVYIDDETSFVAGLHSPALAGRAREILGSLEAPPARYVLMMEADSAPAYGDAGWGRLGSVTMAQEMLYVRMRQLAREAAAAGHTPGDLPIIGFSRVLQLWLKKNDVHIVHDFSGATDADAIVHFEEDGILMLGGLFNSDGYPHIDRTRGGTLDGMIRWLEFFVANFDPEKVEPIIPGRGPIATLADLRAYTEMLVTVKARVLELREGGKTVEDVVAARPTADLDARWGGGPVAPDDFVRMVYASLPNP